MFAPVTRATTERPRPRRTAATASGLVAAALLTALVPSAHAADTQQVIVNRPSTTRLVVGDSLTVGAAPRLTAQGFSIHAKVGRQFSAGPGIVDSYGSRLPRNLVVELGTNGPISPSDCRRIVDRATSARRVFLVTNRMDRWWQGTNNDRIGGCAARYGPSRVRIIDWYAAAKRHPSWIGPDGVHPTAAGSRALATLVDAVVDRYQR